MGVLERLKQKLGIASPDAGRHPIRVFLLEDDERRCEWFAKRFKGDQLDMAAMSAADNGASGSAVRVRSSWS